MTGILGHEMHRLVLTTVAASALAVGVASADAGATKPRVRIMDPAPLVLQGVGFDREEVVRLTVSLGDRTVTRKLRANRLGAFTTRFDAMRYSRCGPALEVKAVGSLGHRVSWQLVPLDCPTGASS
jgi:hypothetical protein